MYVLYHPAYEVLLKLVDYQPKKLGKNIMNQYAVLLSDADRKSPQIATEHESFEEANKAIKDVWESDSWNCFVIFRESGFYDADGLVNTELNDKDKIYKCASINYEPGFWLVNNHKNLQINQHDLGLKFEAGVDANGEFDLVKYH